MCGRYDNLIAREAYKRRYNAMRLPVSNPEGQAAAWAIATREITKWQVPE